MARNKLIFDLCKIDWLTINQIATLVDRNADFIRKSYVNQLTKESKLMLKYPDEIKHPKQAYKTCGY